jgi:hypothetical protein
MSSLPANFRLCDSREQRCALCQQAKYDDGQRAFCMLNLASDTPAEQGRRVNENFVCDLFAAR